MYKYTRINSGTLRLQDELARYASLNIAVRESTKQPTLALDLIRRHPQAIRLCFAEDPLAFARRPTLANQTSSCLTRTTSSMEGGLEFPTLGGRTAPRKQNGTGRSVSTMANDVVRGAEACKFSKTPNERRHRQSPTQLLLRLNGQIPRIPAVLLRITRLH
jgi:hypothetical protein